MADTPNVRFKGFTDAWEQRKLGNLMDVTSVKRIHQSDWTDSGIRFLRARDIVAESKNEEISEALYISGEKYEEYSAISGKVQPGDMLVTGVGTIGVPMLITSDSPIYFKDGNIIWFKNKNKIDGKFFYHSFCGNDIQKYIKESAGIGTVGTYTIESGKKTPINLPSKEEQIKIGEYFANLSHLIILHQHKCDETKELKKYMLQKMFPQNGKNVPQIRFAGFADEWEQRKVRCFMNEGIIEAPMDGNHGEKHPTASEYVSEGIPFLMASDIRNGKADICHCKYITKGRANKLDKGFAKNGDILITHKATIGEVAILQGLKTEYAVLTPQVTYYRIQDESRINQKYLYTYFNTEEFQNDLKTKAAQSTRPYIGISAQQNLTINFPINVKEQEQIGRFFENIDHLITLHQRKCDELKEVRKFMLQNMFPQKG